MSQWRETTLGKVASLVTDKVSAAQITPSNYVSTDNMLPNLGGISPAASIPEADKFNHYKENDTLFSNIRTYFKKVWKADRSGGASADVLIFRTKDEKVLNPVFLYYLMSNQAFTEYTVLTSKGAKMPRGDKEAISRYAVYLPDILEQRTIVEILGALDDKIKLNSRMNASLEEMARALFKSWFVDFDPVRAKAEGREPEGMDTATATLFPAVFNNDGLPEGWDKIPFSGLIEIVGGGTPKTSISEYWNGAIPWFSVVDAPADTDIFVIDTEKKITQAGVDNSSTKVLPFGTTIISARGTVGKVALVGVPMAMNQSCYAMRGANGLPDYFTHFCVRQLVTELKARAHGSVFDTITRETFDTVSFVKPDKKVAQAFDERILPIMQKVLNNLHENKTLSGLRDALLPKLISGELRIQDAREHVKEAV
ncbi:MAG TPA: restriction endonuclease subunit S [Alphaproteobacteria bacterium]|mgnify:CR=1 FL=1|nr:restriction endonuclease subunit S [Alphaproteobacteria bacterium]